MPENGPSPIVVVGAGIAGVSAAEAARAQAPGRAVVLLSDEPSLPYYRLRLIELFDGKADPEALRLHPAAWYADRGIELRLSARVASVDPAARCLVLADGSVQPYSALVVASGSASFLPPVEGAGLPGVRSLWTLDDAMRIREALPSARRAVVVGGGLLGLESAYRISRRGIATTVVEMVPRLLPNQLDPEGSRIFEAQARSLGVEVRTGASIARILGADAVAGVALQDGAELSADLVLFAAGVRPNLGFLDGTGVRIGRRVAVDGGMRTSVDGVFAAGDVAEVDGRWAGVWPAAKAQGAVAGANAAGGSGTFVPEAAPYVLSTLETRVVSIGATGAPPPGATPPAEAYGSAVRSDDAARTYRKLVFLEGRLAGAVLVGDTRGMKELQEAVRAGMPEADARAAGFWNV